MHNTEGTGSNTRMVLFVNHVSVIESQPEHYSYLQSRPVNVISRINKVVANK
jgi:hypothetical protein